MLLDCSPELLVMVLQIFLPKLCPCVQKIVQNIAFTPLSVFDKVHVEFKFKIEYIQANSLTMTDYQVSSYFMSYDLPNITPNYC